MPKHTYGEMIYDKVAAIEKNRQKQRDAGDKNQLAICVIESQGKKVKEQIDVLARALVDDEERLANAGESGGRVLKAQAQEDDDKFMPDVKKCIDSLKANGFAITSTRIWSEWKLLGIEGDPPKYRRLLRLKNKILSLP